MKLPTASANLIESKLEIVDFTLEIIESKHETADGKCEPRRKQA